MHTLQHMKALGKTDWYNHQKDEVVSTIAHLHETLLNFIRLYQYASHVSIYPCGQL